MWGVAEAVGDPVTREEVMAGNSCKRCWVVRSLSGGEEAGKGWRQTCRATWLRLFGAF